MRIIASLFFVLLSMCTVAQPASTTDKKAIQHYDLARDHMKWGRYSEAELYFTKALERDPQFLDAKYDLAELKLAKGDKVACKQLLEEIVTANPRFAPNIIVNLGMLEQMDANYLKAERWFNEYLKIAPPESSNYRSAVLGAASCKFAQQAIQNPVPFDPKNLGANVNGTHNEYFPALTADESLLLFTRAYPNEQAPDGLDEDFFFSVRGADGTWQKNFNPGRPINTPMREGAPTLSPDGNYIIFTACEVEGYYGPEKQGFGSCDLFISQRTGQHWSKPKNLGPGVNSRNWESQPSFASDGKTLYFIRGTYDRERRRSTDIYASELVMGKWTTAVSLPSVVNSPEDEESVFIHPDNQSLYFSSRGHVGMGDMDIYVSRKKPDGGWGDPINLGYPINTAGQENSFHVSASGLYALYASDREGGFGGLDLYSFALPEAVRPTAVTYLRGAITDKKTGKGLEAAFQLIDLNTGDTVVRSSSDGSDGSYLVVLPTGKSYALLAERQSYLFHSENFELNRKDKAEYYEKNIALQPIEAGSAVVLKNVFFDTDKFELKPESKTELNRLVQFLKSNAAVRIEISGHTDNQGSAQANLVLSQNRAKAVMDYLTTNGIEAARLTSVGHGQTKPVTTNDTPEGRAENRRTEFRITE